MNEGSPLATYTALVFLSLYLYSRLKTRPPVELPVGKEQLDTQGFV